MANVFILGIKMCLKNTRLYLGISTTVGAICFAQGGTFGSSGAFNAH